MHEQGHADPATTWNLYVRANDADVSALAGGLGEVVREANTKPAARPKAIDTKGRNPGAPRPGMRGRHPSVAVSATSSQAGESRDRQTEPERPRASDSAVAAGRSLAPVRSRSAAWGLRDRPVAGPQERQHDDDLRPPCPPGRRDQRAVTCWTPDLDVVVQILGTYFSKNRVPPNGSGGFAPFLARPHHACSPWQERTHRTRLAHAVGERVATPQARILRPPRRRRRTRGPARITVGERREGRRGTDDHQLLSTTPRQLQRPPPSSIIS